MSFEGLLSGIVELNAVYKMNSIRYLLHGIYAVLCCRESDETFIVLLVIKGGL